MKLALLPILALVGCGSFGGDPVLYDGKRHVVVYCEQSREHIQYLESEIARGGTEEFVNSAKDMLWNIRFSCAKNS